MKTLCDLCRSTARIRCDSDQANLCWSCDAKVHSANFLVARHSRNLLCRVCRSPARWSAAGSKLQPTVYLCRKCVSGSVRCESSEDEMTEKIDEYRFAAASPPQSPEESSSSCEVVSRKRCRLLSNNRRSHV